MFYNNSVTFGILLLKYSGKDSLTGQVYLLSLTQHNVDDLLRNGF